MPSYRLTEEIARWAFEIRCQEPWYIAFTNPTAGPWKTIKCLDSSRQAGEVYRFGSDENRPDIILVNDLMKLIIIVEAKDRLNALIAGDQAQKSVEVVANLSVIFKNMKTNKFWGDRYQYDIYTSVLWGTESETDRDTLTSVFDAYHAEAIKYTTLDHRSIIGIESCKRADDSIECKMIYKTYEDNGPGGCGTFAAAIPAGHEAAGAGRATIDFQIKSIADTLGLLCEKC